MTCAGWGVGRSRAPIALRDASQHIPVCASLPGAELRNCACLRAAGIDHVVMDPVPSVRAALRRAAEAALADERRLDSRAHTAMAVTVRWHHDPSHPGSHEALDVSEHGLRLRINAPLPEGLTGRVTGVLGGVELDRAAVVAWCRPLIGGCSSHEAGLRFL